MLPEERNIQIPFLEVVAKAADGINFYEACRRVAQYYPEITETDYRMITATGVPWWLNRLQWVRKHLFLSGELVDQGDDLVRCTEAGRARLRVERSSWAPKYSKATTPRGVAAPDILAKDPIVEALDRRRTLIGNDIIIEGLKYRICGLEDAITLIERYAKRVRVPQLEGITRVLKREIRDTKKAFPKPEPSEGEKRV